MKKRFSRSLKKAIIIIAFVVALWVIILAASYLGELLKWILSNWQPILFGVILALLGNMLVELLDKNDKGGN